MLGRNFPFFNSLGGFYPRGNGIPLNPQRLLIAWEAPNVAVAAAACSFALVIWYLFYINIRLDDSAHSDHLQAAWTP